MFKFKIEGTMEPGRVTVTMGWLAKEIMRLWRETNAASKAKEISFSGLGADVKIKVSYPTAPVTPA